MATTWNSKPSGPPSPAQVAGSAVSTIHATAKTAQDDIQKTNNAIVASAGGSGTTNTADDVHAALTAFPANNLINAVSPSVVQALPSGHVADVAVELLNAPTFQPGTVSSNTPQIIQGDKCVIVNADGAANYEVYSNAIPISETQDVDISIRLTWSALTATESYPIRLDFIGYYQGMGVQSQTVSSISSSSSDSPNTSVASDPGVVWTMSSRIHWGAGVDAMAIRMTVASGTVGQVKFSVGSCQQVTGIPSASVGTVPGNQVSTPAFDNINDSMQGTWTNITTALGVALQQDTNGDPIPPTVVDMFNAIQALYNDVVILRDEAVSLQSQITALQEKVNEPPPPVTHANKTTPFNISSNLQLQSWTKTVYIIAVGGGGASGKGYATNLGGVGGAWASGTFSVPGDIPAGSTLSVVVGAGGVPRTYTQGGNIGNASSSYVEVGSTRLVTANGGSGGGGLIGSSSKTPYPPGYSNNTIQGLAPHPSQIYRGPDGQNYSGGSSVGAGQDGLEPGGGGGGAVNYWGSDTYSSGAKGRVWIVESAT